jgi:hypothetical protein
MGVNLNMLNRDPRTYFPDYHAAAQTSNQTTYDHRNQGTNVTHNWEINAPNTTFNERKLLREAEKRLVRSVKGRIR